MYNSFYSSSNPGLIIILVDESHSTESDQFSYKNKIKFLESNINHLINDHRFSQELKTLI